MTNISHELDDAFDAVVMFTWSNWRTEPRSNRYHYATRFARRWPVIFVQATSPQPGVGIVEKVEDHDILIVHAGAGYGRTQYEMLSNLFRDKGIRRPLYWIYNPRFGPFIESRPGQLHVLHATEDYLGEHNELAMVDAALVATFRRLLTFTDLVVAVTDSVAASVRKGGRYEGPLVVVRNGCDVKHWQAATRKPDPAKKIAVYQGGINARLDFEMLKDLADGLPDWRFWFCGSDADATLPQWTH